MAVARAFLDKSGTYDDERNLCLASCRSILSNGTDFSHSVRAAGDRTRCLAEVLLS